MYALARIAFLVPKPALLLAAVAASVNTLVRGTAARRQPLDRPFPFFGE
ncbi:MAG: hypothetical protein ACM33T_12465 [Solirubrobacterales bacterium]